MSPSDAEAADPREDRARTWATPLPDLEHGGNHFVRDHFGAPDATPAVVAVGGAVADPYEVSVQDIRALPAREHLVVLECAGHRRDEYAPAADGVQWGAGALSEARWRGVAVHDLLARARPQVHACEVVLHGADGYARSLPIEKALAPDVLVAYEMNGEPLPEVHGAPLRVVVPGWYATDAIKWLTRIEVADEPFEGRFQIDEYRWVEPGQSGHGDRLTALPVHSLITAAEPGSLRGVAWSDGAAIARVQVRVDGGPWWDAALRSPAERFGLTRWQTQWRARPGSHLIESCASDERGRTQPLRPIPNQGGYANNAIHRVTIEM